MDPYRYSLKTRPKRMDQFSPRDCRSVHTNLPWNSRGPMALKPLWEFWSKPSLVHRVLFSEYGLKSWMLKWVWSSLARAMLHCKVLRGLAEPMCALLPPLQLAVCMWLVTERTNTDVSPTSAAPFKGAKLFLWKLASVLDSWALKPSCGFLPCAPQKPDFLQESAFSCRAGKGIFRQETAFFFWWKNAFSAGR